MRAAAAIAMLMAGCFDGHPLAGDAGALFDTGRGSDAGPPAPPPPPPPGRDAGPPGPIDPDAGPPDRDAGPGIRDAGPEPAVGAGDGVSFRLEWLLTYASGHPRLPETLDSTLWLRDRPDGTFDAVLSTPSGAYRQTVVRAPSGALPLVYTARPFVDHGWCAIIEEYVLRADVILRDDTGDGIADRLEGAGNGSLVYRATDFFTETHSFTATVTGRAEREPPSLRWIGWIEGHVPISRLDAPFLFASEPVRYVGAAWLQAPDGSRIPLAPYSGSAEDTLRMVWRIDSELPFPLGVDLVPTFDGPIADLTGIALAAPVPLRTLPLPTRVAREGFEAGTTAYHEGDVRLGTLGSLPPLAGSASALVASVDWGGPGGGRLVQRLAVPAGATRIRMLARYVGRWRGGVITGEWPAPVVPVAANAPDGTSASPATWPRATAHVSTGDAEWGDASEVVTLDVPLPSGARDEVTVTIGRNWGCIGMIPVMTGPGLLVDDLRVE